MSDNIILTNVLMTQSTGQKSNMPTAAPNGKLLIVRDEGKPTELWCGTGAGVEQIASGGGGGTAGSGHNIFDVIWKDHVLSYEETAGLAPLGTYVYREAIPGSRYGYPDFYQKCIDEYNSSTIISEYRSSNISTVGTLTNNSGVISGFNSTSWAILPENFTPLTSNWSFKIKFKTGTIGTVQDIFNCSSLDWQPYQLSINPDGTLLFQGYDNGTSTLLFEITSTTVLDEDTDYYALVSYASDNGYLLELSTDDVTYTTEGTDPTTTPINGGNNIALGADFSSGAYYEGAFTGSIDLNESYINIGNSRWWTGTDGFIYKQNSNKHRFYDIKNKPTFDNMYAITGEAWYYGIDFTNERIFLPRSTRFKNGNTSDVGEYQEAGLPELPRFTTDGFYWHWQSGAHYNITSAGYNGTMSSGIYGKSNTVEYSSTKLIPYMVIGNTEQTTEIVNVVDVTTTNNDTVPLFTGLYFDYTPNNVSWVIAGGETINGTIYEFAYSELVNELTTPKYNLNVIDVNDMVVGTDYSTYWKVDQNHQTFTCPTRLSYGALTGSIQGNGMTLGLMGGGVTKGAMNIGSDQRAYISSDAYGKLVGQSATGGVWTSVASIGVTSEPENSGLTATNSTTAKLYFKVANAVQNLELLDAGAVMTAVNDIASKPHIIETYENGLSGYIIWSNGYCEQWGHNYTPAVVSNDYWIVDLLKTYRNTNYGIQITFGGGTPSERSGVNNIFAWSDQKYGNRFNWGGIGSNTASWKFSGYWKTYGYLAQGEY